MLGYQVYQDRKKTTGIDINIGERDNEIKRITPRENEAVNEIWLCDKGRFAHHYTNSAERLTTLTPSAFKAAVNSAAPRTSIASTRTRQLRKFC